MEISPLNILSNLVERESRIVGGVMSGTSADAIDIAIVRLSGNGENTKLKLLHYAEIPYLPEIRQMIFDCSEPSTSTVSEICLLHAALAHSYADAVRRACSDAGMDAHDIDLIGLHGQTIHHLPMAVEIGTHAVRSTLQAGSGSTLAALLETPVVSDFRSADMALGGQGAPLVPYMDYLLFRSHEAHRILLNIGGIANLTCLPAGCGADDVVAYDTGPGNIVVDALMRRFFGKDFDEGGRVAGSGGVHPDLLSWILSRDYFHQTPPKSTGRESFGQEFIGNLIQIASDFEITEPEDIIATVSEATVRSVVNEIRRLVPKDQPFDLITSGGGAKNTFFIEGFRFNLGNADIKDSGEFGIPSDAKEAICFAVLANEWVFGNTASMPGVTGARRKTLLGSLSLG